MTCASLLPVVRLLWRATTACFAASLVAQAPAPAPPTNTTGGSPPVPPVAAIDKAVADGTRELVTLFSSTMPDRSGAALREPVSLVADDARRQEQLARCAAKLQQLPRDNAIAVYTGLLKALATGPDQSPDGKEGGGVVGHGAAPNTRVAANSRIPANGQQGTGGEPGDRTSKVLRATDIVELLRLPPWSPDGEQLHLLADMVRARLTAPGPVPPQGDPLVERCAALATESRELRDRVIRVLLAAWPAALGRCLPPIGDVLRQDDVLLLIAHQASFPDDGPEAPPLATRLAVQRRILELLPGATDPMLIRDRDELRRRQLGLAGELTGIVHAADRRSLFEFLAAHDMVAEFGAVALDAPNWWILRELVLWLASCTERNRTLEQRLATSASWKWCELARTPPNLEESSPPVQSRYAGFDPGLDAYCTDPELLAELAGVRLEYAILASDFPRALDVVVTSGRTGPGTTERLARRYFAAWGSSRDPALFFQGGGSVEGSTRPADAQECAIAELAEAWTRVSELPGGATLRGVAFNELLKVHSWTEVYRIEDFERVFGPFDTWPSEQVCSFANEATERLGSQWSEWKLQTKAATGRSEAGHALEVERAMSVIERACRLFAMLEPSLAWRASLWQSIAWTNWARFARSGKTDTNKHGERRKAALAFARQALSEYCELRAHGQTARSIQPLSVYFHAMVDGRQDVAPAQLDEMARSLAALGPAEEAWHQDALVAGMRRLLGEAAPEEAYFLAKGFVYLLAGRRDIQYARDLIDRCDEFRAGVRVHVEIDGAIDVGVDQPFGIRLSFHYRERAMLVTHGFGRYLRNESESEHNPPILYRDDLEASIRDVLASRFHLDAVVLANPDVMPKRLAGTEPGWFETSCAYVIARARDRSVDAVPAMSFDLDVDPHGDTVVVPVHSAIVPIRAAVASVVPRPVAGVHVTQTLDERELEKGRLAVAVQVRAVGVPPGIGRLLRLPEGPYRVERVTDERLSVTGLDQHGAPVVELTADLLIDASDAGPRDSFEFPVVGADLSQPVRMEWRRFPLTALETGLESVPARVTLRGWRRDVPTTLLWWIGGIAVLIAVVMLVRRWPAKRPPAPAVWIDPPTVADGPSVSLFLRRIAAAFATELSPEARAALNEDLERVERAAFSGAEDDAEVDFGSVARRWSERVRVGRAG